jgi:hypothetical protein
MIKLQMLEQHSRTRERWIASAVVLALVVARSSVFVVVGASHFDSDQAVTGLMAKHLSEGRAFPVFWYGQKYLLGVEAWLAAPVMWLFGPSVTALKLPLLAINIAIAVLLLRIFERDAGLRPASAAFAASPFVLAAPITTAQFMMANGANIEPFLYVLLLWIARRRPVWLGVILGIGFLNREFTIYGALALVLLEAAHRRLLQRETLTRFSIMIGIAAAIWTAIQVLERYSSTAGPGTTIADLSGTLPANNLLELVRRTCIEPATMMRGVGKLFASHWPTLFGLQVRQLTDAGIESRNTQGLTGSAFLLIAAAGVPLVLIVARLMANRRWLPEYDPCAYLTLVGLLSVTGYVGGRCGVVAFNTMRYELLSVLGAAGVFAWYLIIERSPGMRTAWMAIASLVLCVSVAAHARLIAEYLTGPPVPAKQLLIEQLDARGVHYGYADFWVAYYVTFMTRERVQLAATDAVRIRTYNRVVDAHRDEARRVSRTRCAGGEQITPAFWLCDTN